MIDELAPRKVFTCGVSVAVALTMPRATRPKVPPDPVAVALSPSWEVTLTLPLTWTAAGWTLLPIEAWMVGETVVCVFTPRPPAMETSPAVPLAVPTFEVCARIVRLKPPVIVPSMWASVFASTTVVGSLVPAPKPPPKNEWASASAALFEFAVIEILPPDASTCPRRQSC